MRAGNLRTLALGLLLLAAAPFAVQAQQSPEVGFGADAILRDRSGQAFGTAANPFGVKGQVYTSTTDPFRVQPWNGTPIASAVTSLGTTSTAVFAASSQLKWLIIQNQSTTALVWCNPAGAAATAGPPGILIAPRSAWMQTTSFVTSSAINCISDTAATPIAGWRY